MTTTETKTCAVGPCQNARTNGDFCAKHGTKPPTGRKTSIVVALVCVAFVGLFVFQIAGALWR